MVDLASGKLLAREPQESGDWFDAARRAALGIGPLDGTWIDVCGLAGGRLPDATADGWRAQAAGDCVTISAPGCQPLQINESEELRAFGFSPDGTSFVIATPSSLAIYRRKSEGHAAADAILELQRAFDDAELRGDADRLDALLADDFRSIGEQGYQLGKREWIDRHRDFRYLSIETTELDVRNYDKTAIVRCAQRSRASWRGEEMALAVRLSQVWIRQPDGWRLVAIQFSALGSG